MTSVEDVARRAGVSPITVSRVVNNRDNVSDATRARVLEAITSLNYIPNAAARGLKRSRSGLIALIITDITSPFFTAVARGAEDAARAAGFVLLQGNSDEDAMIEAEYLRAMGELRVEGVALVPSPDAGEAVKRRLPPGVPVVLLDRNVPSVEADVVRCDTRAGTTVLCRHLLALGHRRIAIVGGLPRAETWGERVAGYRAAFDEAGLPPAARLEVLVERRAPPVHEVGAAAVGEVLARGDLPDVIIASNSQVSLGVLDELARRGYRVPEDVGVASIDDPLPKLRESDFWPRLTAVEQPGYDMGRVAVELLVERSNEELPRMPPRQVVFDAALRIGTSCGEAIAGRPRIPTEFEAAPRRAR